MIDILVGKAIFRLHKMTPANKLPEQGGETLLSNVSFIYILYSSGGSLQRRRVPFFLGKTSNR